MITEVLRKPSKYGRTAYLAFENDELIFDVADDEYNKGVVPIEWLEKKLEEHKKS